MRLRLAVLTCTVLCALAAAGSASPAPGLQLGLVDDGFLYHTTGFLDRALNLGVRVVRVDVLWNPGSSTWGNARFASQLRVLVADGPTWNVRVVASFMAPRARDVPQTDQARHQFCSAAASLVHDIPQISDVIIANEPNSNAFWQPQFDADGNPVSPQAYFQLVSLCYDMLHAVRPDVNVVGPATSFRGNDDPHAASNAGLSPTAFIADLGAAYRASGRTAPIFDTIDHHPYPLNASERPWKQHPSDKVIGEGDLARLVGAYQQAFAGTGQPTPGTCVAGKCVSIWYTEDGFQTKPDDSSSIVYTGRENDRTALAADAAAPVVGLPSETSAAPSQGTQLRDAVTYAWCQPYVTAFFNFQLEDDSVLSGWQSGILYADGTEKDSYRTFVAVGAQLRAGQVDCSRFQAALRRAP